MQTRLDAQLSLKQERFVIKAPELAEHIDIRHLAETAGFSALNVKEVRLVGSGVGTTPSANDLVAWDLRGPMDAYLQKAETNGAAPQFSNPLSARIAFSSGSAAAFLRSFSPPGFGTRALSYDRQ